MRATASSARAGRWPAWAPQALRAALVALACGLLLLTPTWRSIDDRSFDLVWTLLPPTVPAEPRIVVVAIDEPSFAELGSRWPWPRARHAELIDVLTKAGARAIGFDIIFAEPSTVADDTALAAAIARSGRVVLASDEAMVRNEHVEQRLGVDPLPAGAVRGFVGIDLDRDGILRRLPVRVDLFAGQDPRGRGPRGSATRRATPALAAAPAPGRRLPHCLLLPGARPPTASCRPTCCATPSCSSASWSRRRRSRTSCRPTPS